jgi:hypothetical protein
MVTVAILLLLVGGIVSANLFGLRMFQTAEAKMSATDGARNSVGVLVDEVHRSSSFQIGTVTNGTFTGLTPGNPLVGTGLIIYPTTTTTNFILYYVNTVDKKFRRATNVRGSTKVLAQSITNEAGVFRGQDFAGNLLTNAQNNTVLHLTLEFYQAVRYGVPPDYFKLETSVTRR